MGKHLTVLINEQLLEAILNHARMLYPKETVFLLRGEIQGNIVRISELIIPPLATYGEGFANIQAYILPIDFSIVGTVHSHPSGELKPSPTDLNHFWGKILMIVGFPFANHSNVAVYNYKGEKLPLELENIE